MNWMYQQCARANIGLVRRVFFLMGIVLTLSITSCDFLGGKEKAEDTGNPGSQVESDPRVHTLTIAPDSMYLWAGDTMEFTVTALDESGMPINDPVIQWSVENQWSADNSVRATITESGVLTALVPGKLRVTASAGANVKATNTTFIGATLQGEVFTADSGMPENIWVFTEFGEFKDSSKVAVDGTYMLTSHAYYGEETRFYFDTREAERVYKPSLWVEMVLDKSEYDAVLIPDVWTFKEGMYTGLSIDVPLDSLFYPVRFGTEIPYRILKGWHDNYARFLAGRHDRRSVAWPRDAFPIHSILSETASASVSTQVIAQEKW